MGRASVRLGRLQSTKACADSDCGLVEFVAVSLPPVSIDLEPIASEAGKDVQVDVENLLEGSFTVGEKQVYAFALQPRPTQRPPQPVGHLPHLHSDFLLQVLQPHCVCPGDDEQMTWSHRLQVHKCHHRIVFVDQAAHRLTSHNRAENTSTACHDPVPPMPRWTALPTTAVHVPFDDAIAPWGHCNRPGSHRADAVLAPHTPPPPHGSQQSGDGHHRRPAAQIPGSQPAPARCKASSTRWRPLPPTCTTRTASSRRSWPPGPRCRSLPSTVNVRSQSPSARSRIGAEQMETGRNHHCVAIDESGRGGESAVRRRRRRAVRCTAWRRWSGPCRRGRRRCRIA
ncbi:MAG: hypothetical protein QOF84_2742 [Streptomyces sp.]|nr:hypothetical protein [Streptomyces sp.]